MKPTAPQRTPLPLPQAAVQALLAGWTGPSPAPRPQLLHTANGPLDRLLRWLERSLGPA